MAFKGPIKIPLISAFVNLVPAKLGISRLEWAAPIGRGLVRGPARRKPLLNNSVID